MTAPEVAHAWTDDCGIHWRILRGELSLSVEIKTTAGWEAITDRQPAGAAGRRLAEEIARLVRPWTYCVDGLPAEPGRYEAALVIPSREPYTAARYISWFVGDDGSKGWIGEVEGICYAWRPAPELPRPRRRDLTEWPSLGSYLERLEP